MIVGTSPGGSADYREVDYTTRPVVLIMGSERTGISPEQAALCDQLVRIPMAGYVESLNLSIAAALVLYEVLRQHEAKEAARARRLIRDSRRAPSPTSWPGAPSKDRSTS
jgi:tRNA G18 (ribose-2'-O)-methylase SpoU